MSEKPETVHVVLRGRIMSGTRFRADIPVKVAEDRKDARAYAERMSARSAAFFYVVRSCPKL